MPYRVALVDDEPDFAAELAAYLEANGCAVSQHGSGASFLGALVEDRPDLVILDHRLRGETGIAVLRQLRTISDLPCIMLTGAASEVDRILSLELGADDHVEKSASPRELLARISAVLRRTGALPRRAQGEALWRLDDGRRDVIRPDGQGIGLTAAEYRVLAVLAAREGQAVERGTICEEALGCAWQAADRPVDVPVARLRRKLEGQDCIRSLRGRGYLFVGFEAG
ncbi:response regulator transcription factor [Dankookia sp. GCM10030260]|uniref:response regulator transcription factor n=1 Tax=Dankookia sp. GCM10030260 TaxID=3273390 RepID=UPI00361431A3